MLKKLQEMCDYRDTHLKSINIPVFFGITVIVTLSPECVLGMLATNGVLSLTRWPQASLFEFLVWQPVQVISPGIYIYIYMFDSSMRFSLG